MKSQKILSLDTEIIEEMKNLPNASKLINEMLKDYFNQHGAMKKQELENKLRKKEIDREDLIKEIKIIHERLEEIKVRERRLKTVFKDIPIEIMLDFKAFPNMTRDILFGRFKAIYSKSYNLTFKEVVDAWDNYKDVE